MNPSCDPGSPFNRDTQAPKYSRTSLRMDVCSESAIGRPPFSQSGGRGLPGGRRDVSMGEMQYGLFMKQRQANWTGLGLRQACMNSRACVVLETSKTG